MKQKKKLWIASMLMTLSILLLVLLQAYWLNRSYRDEFRRLKRDVSINLRVSVMQEQVKLSGGLKEHFEIRSVLGDSIKFKENKLPGFSKADTLPASSINIIVASDSSKMPGPPKILSFEQDRGMDDMESANNMVVEFPVPLGSTNIDTLSKNYKAALLEAGIDLDFKMKMVSADSSRLKQRANGNFRFSRGVRKQGGSVEVFKKGIEFVQASFENPFWLLLKKIQWQLFFAFIMIAVTATAFVFLYRNLLQQQRLADMKSELISNITHELKTPIATVSVAIEALKSFDAIKDVSKTKTYLDISSKELQRLNLLVDRVLKLSLFEQDQVSLQYENLDLQLLINEVLNSLKLQFEKHNATVNFHVNGSGFLFSGDKMHMVGVLYNLFDNAIKYSKEPAIIDVTLGKQDDTLIISIADKGIGIPAGYRKKIFDKFFRVPHGDTHNIKGYGLGLSYVCEVITRHGGTIEAKPRQEAGTEFFITLPSIKMAGTTIA